MVAGQERLNTAIVELLSPLKPYQKQIQLKSYILKKLNFLPGVYLIILVNG